VLRTVAQVEELAAYYEKATAKNPLRGGKFHRKYDYVQKPKDTGYRSVHLVYRYHSTSPSLRIYDELKIEIQLRSKLQHYWATAVETVDFLTGQALKSNIGDVLWKRFFVVVANEFARLEKRPLVPGASSNEHESKSELRSYSAQIALLEGLSAATAIVTSKEALDKSEGQFYLLELDLNSRTIQTKSFRKDQSAEAQEKYLEVEKSNKDRPEKQSDRGRLLGHSPAAHRANRQSACQEGGLIRPILGASAAQANDESSATTRQRPPSGRARLVRASRLRRGRCGTGQHHRQPPRSSESAGSPLADVCCALKWVDEARVSFSQD